MNSKKLVIAGGGTGGHIFPGLAVAEEWRSRGGEVIFVGTPRGKEVTLVPKAGFDLHLIPVGQLKGRGLFRKFKTLLGLPVALMRAFLFLRSQKPAAVLGIGGYASGPVTLAAKLLGVSTAITDQNAMPGLTNRVLGRFVDRVYLAFLESSSFFASKKVLHTGNPVRSQIVPRQHQARQNDFCIFVFGGSQGAVGLNRLFLDAVGLLAKSEQQQIQFIHQAGPSDVNQVKNFYAEQGIQATVATFFDDMNACYQKADLVICRSGAGTVTEIALSGCTAIFIPYPHAADDHQRFNAKVFVDQNAGWLMDEKSTTPQELSDLILRLKHDEALRIQAAQNAQKLAHPQAAKMIVDDLLQRKNCAVQLAVL